jgi:thioredoxin 1
MIILNKDNFKTEVSTGFTLVDFYSTNCGPCRTLEPILNGLEDKVKAVKFAKIEASDDGMDVFSDYGISHVPTMILFKDGKVVDRKSGMMKEKDLTEWLDVKAVN